ncbi:MAG: flagellar biosynthetic protein FliP [Planctomycetaceae bacterium]|nr:MAG: flagellar biosynthetic protein FliP [Planctomycetaceae bacterium]
MPAVEQSKTEPSTAPTTSPATAPADISAALPGLKTPDEVSGTLKWILLATALSVAPAVLVLVTCFTRIIVVLGLLRAALATPQLPPNQVIFGLALLMTVVVMMPTGNKVYRDAVEPYMAGRISQTQALTTAEGHARAFMIRQIDDANNQEDVFLFISEADAKNVKVWKDVPTIAMIPGFVVSELKVAFSMGFRFFLPFLIIDMLIASVLVSMGMLMVPPVLISLPFKLLLFVLADGWHLVIGTLMTSFG